jgi:PAS domain S-box-containing protein
MLKSGEADAFVSMGNAEPIFERYGDVVLRNFYPLVFASASLSTQNPDLEPVISLVQKALDNGGTRYLAGLFSQGHRDYIKNKFFERLTPEELEYIQQNPVVKVVTQSDNYPLSFYNRNDDELQGIAFDVMEELERMTGLSFEVVSSLNESFSVFTNMVESGEASMITAMMRTREREESFLLSAATIITEYPALISKSEFPNVHFNELANVTVGLVRGTLYAELFKRWFPNNTNFREYDNLDNAFNALERGDVDMFMSMSNSLLSIQNYKEFTDFKANVVFDNNFDITFGFNKNEATLCSIVDKALALIDLEDISRYWTFKRYDYRVKVAEARLPWLIGAIFLSIITLGMMLAMFYRSRNEGKRLEKVVAEKTSILTAILDATPDLIFFKDSDLRHTECNKSLEKHLNIRKSDIIGKNDAEAFNFPPDLNEHYAVKDKQVIAEKQISIVEEIIPSADGRMQFFETIKSPIIQHGEATGLVGISRDITQRKAAAESLNRQNSLMGAVNAAAAVLLEPDTDGFNAISHSMEMVCQSLDADRVFLWKNIHKDDGKLYYKQVCKWMRSEYDMGGNLLEYTYEKTMPAWKDLLFEGKSINGPLDTLPGYDSESFSIYTLQSILIIPLFLKEEYWGFVSFDDCHSRRSFPETDEHILRSWGLLVVGAIQRGNIMRDLEYAVAEAEAANRAKSSFLASMSHEIRTPMNAISGMAELLLRRDLSDEAKAEAQDIKQAATNLVSIINDILDFSKIEAGKMEIIPAKYMLLSLINDTINIIRIRLAEKPIRFYTNIDGKIPNNLIGDEVRLRQILLNLLSNAIKYTDKGHISLSIIVQKRKSEQIWLEITVADTGKGIKPEDQAKIFDSFVQVDSKKNRSIEGTGLGLAITRQLCMAMNGNIAFHSEYGKGSEFKAVIPQGVVSEEAFAAVEEPEKKKVLVYEGRAVYARSLCWSLENLGVPYVMTETLKEFTEALPREEWYYIFSGYGLYERIKSLMDKAVYPDGKKPLLALMVEWENEANIPNVRFISLPVQSLSIANVLNGKADSRSNFNTQNFGVIRFTYPDARLLVVDDIPTNLKVAEGLLAPYHAKVDTALSGAKAIELVKQYEYDIVFMDHMMPEMDGIEATARIRSWEAAQGIAHIAIPIIALTANAVSGMKEMFIENGFNDFLAKPIDISKLDEILDRWIPREKRGNREWGGGNATLGNGERSSNDDIASGAYPSSPNSDPLLPIPGIDVQRGIAMTGGTLALYRQVIGLFRNDAEERLPLLQDMPDASALHEFVNHVHALKSASASIGAAEISAMAAKLEAAGRAADIGLIRENLPGFAEELSELVKGIRTWENAKKEQAAPKGEDPLNGHDQAAVTQLLRELAAALGKEDVGDIRRFLRELGEKPCNEKTKEALEQISDRVMMAEFDGALKIVRELTAANG